jgi:phosphohistidine phosphatase
MAKLIVLRHAKSDWSTEGLADFDRPLNSRGQKDAPKMGEYLNSHGHVPDLILCSASKRTRETRALLDLDVKTKFLEELYHASAPTLLDIIRQQKSLASLMIIAHNPGITNFVNKVCHEDIENVPTCAAAIIEVELESICFGSGKLIEFLKPKVIFSASN